MERHFRPKHEEFRNLPKLLTLPRLVQAHSLASFSSQFPLGLSDCQLTTQIPKKTLFQTICLFLEAQFDS